MTHKCPSCAAEVPGVVLQGTFEERLNSQRDAKDGEILLLRGQLTEAAGKASRFDGTELERARLAGELVRITEGAARRDALVELQIHDPTVHATFGVLYDSAVAGLDGESRPSFSDWVADIEGGARLNPVLAPLFAAPVAAPVAAALPVASAGPSAFPPPAAHVKPGVPLQDPKIDAGQIRRMLQGMTVSEVSTWRQEHGAKYGWAPDASAAV